MVREKSQTAWCIQCERAWLVVQDFHNGDTTILVWVGLCRIIGGQLLSKLTSRDDDNGSQRCGEYRTLSKRLYTHVTLSQSAKTIGMAFRDVAIYFNFRCDKNLHVVRQRLHGTPLCAGRALLYRIFYLTCCSLSTPS